MVQRRLLELFVCPRCGGSLAADDGPGRDAGVLFPGSPVPRDRGVLDLRTRPPPSTPRRHAPSRASATSGTPSTTCATRTPIRRGVLPRPRHVVAGGQGRARRRLRQGPLHALPGPTSRRPGRPGRLERGRGSGAQPRPSTTSSSCGPTSAVRPWSRAASTSSCAWECSITSRTPAPGSRRSSGCCRPPGGSSCYLYSRPSAFGPAAWRWRRRRCSGPSRCGSRTECSASSAPR